MYRLLILIFTLSFSTAGLACGGYSCNNPSLNLNAAFGYANFANAMNQDGKAAAGRLSLGGTIFREKYGLGIEGGIQTGNIMHLKFSKEELFALGGVPLEVQIKPLLDLLLSLQVKINDDSLFGIIKGGMAYRQMQVDEQAVNDLSSFSPEIQAGIGYQIGEQLFVNLIYQHVFGKAPTLTVDSLNETGILANIPAQQAIMLGVSWHF